MHAVVAEELANGAARERRKVLHRRRVGGGGGDDDRIGQRPVILQNLDELRYGRALLADGDVDAIEALLVVAERVDRFLVEDGVQDDGGLAGLAVAYDELALAAADGNERVDGLQASLHRLMHRLARNDAGRLHVDAALLFRLDRPLAVDRIAARIDHAAEQGLADRPLAD